MIRLNTNVMILVGFPTQRLRFRCISTSSRCLADKHDGRGVDSESDIMRDHTRSKEDF